MRGFLLSFFLFLLFSILGFVALLKIAGHDLPSPSHLQAYTPAVKTRVYDRHGRPVGDFYRENRILVTLEDTPRDLVNAFIAVEDRSFRDHWGIHLPSVMRAVVRNVVSFRVRQGASTITQQLARNLFLTHEQTWTRKIREAVLAVRIEQSYSKDEILEMYLNQIYFGDGAYGIQSAARGFFGKDVEDLSLSECALLAGLPRNPRGYSPFRHPDAAKRRRGLVLTSMEECGFIDEARADSARNTELRIAASPLNPDHAPYFMEMVRQFLEKEVGSESIYEGGLTVYTTLDLDWQSQAEKALEDEMVRLEKETRTKQNRATYLEARDKGKNPVLEYLQGAALVFDAETGSIRVLIGGRSFDESNFNRATSALRQPGSAFKPFIYLTAIQKGYYPSYVVLDAPVVFYVPGQEPWRPLNYDREFRGPVNLRFALQKSLNVPTIKIQEEIGTPDVIRTARIAGIHTPIPEFRSIALGTAEVTLKDLVYAYGVFANGGIRVEPYFVTRIEDQSGNVIRDYKPIQREVLDAAPVAILNSMLQSVLDHGTGAGARSNGFLLPAAGKTGTTDDYSDAWFVGYTPKTVTGVWVGYDKPRTIGGGMSGTRAALPLWTRIMKTVTAGDEGKSFEIPEGVVVRSVCPDTGLPATARCPSPIPELFLAGQVPAERCNLHSGSSRYRDRKRDLDWSHEKEEERRLDSRRP
jgi:penicillin-binding protein 1A